MSDALCNCSGSSDQPDRRQSRSSGHDLQQESPYTVRESWHQLRSFLRVRPAPYPGLEHIFNLIWTQLTQPPCL